MSELSLEEVDNIARLARLRLSADERVQYQKQLSAILGYVNTLQGIDTSGVEANFTVLPREPLLRADEVRSCLPQEATLANAPVRHEGYFRIPRILED
ncbi:MAG TPA: Asp-tRNA(Asn)/Glu-tRNA(Gln) amidotransferase subunit GatC [Candidatus Xenobia bacterium]|jgi:aspartyl-tRNA(Asn)/glutamyl-tRNA(Gln) amidotransferase subunit C